ncbi:MAG: hypothetical protein ACOYL3_27130, partial [Desulfuromonadaceae bacterium]
MAKAPVVISTLDKVLTYQTTVADTKLKRNNLRKIIADKETEISGMTSFSSTLPELAERRENILADMLLGVNRQPELDQVNAEITAETKRQSDHTAALSQATATATPALAGLRRKLASIESELATLKGLSTAHILDVLKEDAEQIAVAYVQSVSDMAAKATQLRALSQLIKNYGGNISNNYTGQELTAPVFNLKACLDAVHPAEKGRFAALVACGTYQDINPFVAAEKERIKSYGVEL